MTDTKSPLPHKLTLTERKQLHMTGATEVIHFDAEQAELNTALGRIWIRGSELKLKCLSLDDGAVVISGSIQSMEYLPERPMRRFLR